jgi:hypothetical protein
MQNQSEPEADLSDVGRLDTALMNCGLYLGLGAKRRELAERLEAEGMQPPDVHAVWEHVLRSAHGDVYKAQVFMLGRLKTKATWRPLVRELRHFEERGWGKREKLENAPQREYEPMVSMRERARCWVNHDQVSKEQTAEMLGIGMVELEELLNEEPE